MLARSLALVVHFDDDRASVAVAQRRLEGLGQPLLEFRAHLEPVDDDLDRVLRVLGEPRNRVDLVHLAVDANANETLRAKLDEELELLALAVDDDRREDHELRILRKRERRVDHLRNGHRRELLLRVIRTVRIADPRVEEAQVVVDLGDRAYGRAGVVRRRLLLDRDRRREALDQVDIGLFHQLQELARVRRQRFDVAALPLGVQGVEGERALPRSRKPRHDDEPLPRQLEIDVLEVMRARAANADVFHAGGVAFSSAARRFA